jgi:hypothetical protein
MSDRAVHSDAWIDRVRAADAEAEQQWQELKNGEFIDKETVIADSLIAIAAELRAQRIARRPGLGKI